MRKTNNIPTSALWLGGTGAIPFVALGLATLVSTGDAQAGFANALMLYGAVILSFLGGVHWGLAMAEGSGGAPTSVSPEWLAMSVMPSLLGWGAVLLPNLTLSATALAAGFLFMLFIDIRAAGRLQVPAWYPKLRWPLTLTVALSLMVPVVAL